MSAGKVLVVDDEPDIRNLIQEILEDERFEVATAGDAEQAEELRKTFTPDVVLLDIWMPGVDGISLLKRWRQSERAKAPVIMLSGHGNVETAVEATRLGAYDFIEKPLSLAKLVLTVKHALESVASPKENVRLKNTGQQPDAPVGKSVVMRELRRQVAHIAAHEAPTLIVGASGVGKTLFARYLHAQSARASNAFVDVAISTLSPKRVVADFFGDEAGGDAHAGFFRRAEGGTLFIKDIADLDPQLQAKLQHVLEHKSFNGAGESQAREFDVRILAATSHDLLERVRQGHFSEDLYYQLNVLSLRVPPLSGHSEDIPELLDFYVNYFVETQGLSWRRFTVPAQNRLRGYAWPGNVRELKNLVQRLLLLGDSELIDVDEIDLSAALDPDADPHGAQSIFDLPLRQAREKFEREYLQHQLQAVGGNVSKAAELAGMERTHLYRKLKSLGIVTRGQ